MTIKLEFDQVIYKFISDPDGAIAKVIKEAEEVWKPFITPEVRLVFLISDLISNINKSVIKFFLTLDKRFELTFDFKEEKTFGAVYDLNRLILRI